MVQKSESAEHGVPHQKAPIAKTPHPPKPEPAPFVSKVSVARSAVREFLSTELGAREVRITKIVPVDHGSEGWIAEAEILVPNLEVKMLGLPLTQEVLEREHYSLELEADLTVRSYEHLRPEDD